MACDLLDQLTGYTGTPVFHDNLPDSCPDDCS